MLDDLQGRRSHEGVLDHSGSAFRACDIARCCRTEQQQQPVPPGVSEANWILIGDKVGFVITPAVANHDPTVLAGYFLAWHENAWKRIDSEGGFRFQPLKK